MSPRDCYESKYAQCRQRAASASQQPADHSRQFQLLWRNRMTRTLSALTLLGALLAVAAPCAMAQDAAAPAPKAAKKPAAKKTATKKSAKKAAVKQDAAAHEDDGEPDVAGSKSTDFQCDLGNKITIYENDADEKHIALRWNKRLTRMTRIGTTTGANRFENRSQGLVWIGIPAKSMLLDAKKGQQLANECKSAQEWKPQPANAPAAAGAAAPAPASADQGTPATVKQ
jgi:hypothetical protein